MTQEKFNEVANEMVIEDIAKQKFTYQKVGGFYYIIDSETGNKVSLYGKVFRAKGVTKLGKTLFMLREAYKKQLENQKEIQDE